MEEGEVPLEHLHEHIHHHGRAWRRNLDVAGRVRGNLRPDQASSIWIVSLVFGAGGLVFLILGWIAH